MYMNIGVGFIFFLGNLFQSQYVLVIMSALNSHRPYNKSIVQISNIQCEFNLHPLKAYVGPEMN